MKKRKRQTDKGFSLAELIMVIGILTFLVVILVPQLMKLVERSQVSNDERVADLVRKSVMTALMDNAVTEDEDYAADIKPFQRNGGASIIYIGSNTFGDKVAAALGERDGSVIDEKWVSRQLSSRDAEDIIVEIIDEEIVRVTIKGSHSDAAGGRDPIVVQ